MYQTYHSTDLCFLLTLKVVVTWPSQVKTRKLKTVLEPLGKALINGTWSNIAGAVFRVKELRVELCKFFVKEIGRVLCYGFQEKPFLAQKDVCYRDAKLVPGKYQQ